MLDEISGPVAGGGRRIIVVRIDDGGKTVFEILQRRVSRAAAGRVAGGFCLCHAGEVLCFAFRFEMGAFRASLYEEDAVIDAPRLRVAVQGDGAGPSRDGGLTLDAFMQHLRCEVL